MTLPPFQHKVLTRMNVRTAEFAKFGPIPPGWMESRLDLFERYCLPTMAAQTCQNFEWILICDSGTEPHVLERLRSYGTNISLLLVPPKEDGGKTNWYWNRTVGKIAPETEIVVTTRLDNDDGLHRRAIERVQEHIADFVDSGQERLVHSFPHGYRLAAQTGQVYATTRPKGPFLSLLERRGKGAPLGALCMNHMRVRDRFPTVQDEELRGYVQVIHGGNLVNALRDDDELVDASVLGDDFPVRH